MRAAGIERAAGPTQERAADQGLRARRLGAFAGMTAIFCCVYPIVLVLLGLASAAEAIALGNFLFAEWGWAFKLGGGILALAGIVIQLRRRNQCSVKGAVSNKGYIARVAVVTVGVYVAVFYGTKALAAWGS